MKKLFKRFFCWFGWTLKKRFLLCFIVFIGIAILVLKLDSLPFLSSIAEKRPLFVGFMLLSALIFMVLGPRYLDPQRNWRFAIEETDEEMAKIEAEIDPSKVDSSLKDCFKLAKDASRKTLDPSYAKNWMKEFQDFRCAKKDLIRLKANKADFEITSKEELLERLYKEEQERYKNLCIRIEKKEDEVCETELQLIDPHKYLLPFIDHKT